MADIRVGGARIDFVAQNARFVAAVKRNGDALRRQQQAVRRLQGSVRSFNRTARAMVGRLASVGGVLVGGFGVAAATRVIARFGETMATVRGITGATEDQFRRLESQALDLGRSTRFSSAQAAEGQAFLARAGFEVNEIYSALPATLRLAQAAQVEIGQSADIVSNVLAAFGREAEDTGELVDILAKTVTSANTDMIQLADALKLVAPVANSLGVSVETTAAAVGVLSDAGLQATLAGTGLRKVLFDLQNPTANTRGVLRELGLTAAEVSIENRGLVQVLELLRDRGIDATQAIQIFGARGTPAFLNLVSNTPRLRELSETLGEAGGTAEELARTMDDTLQGAMLRVVSAAQGFVLEFAETSSAGESLKNSLDGLADSINRITDNMERVVEIGGTLLKVLGFLAAHRVIGRLLRMGANAATAGAGFAAAAKGAERLNSGLRLAGAQGRVGVLVRDVDKLNRGFSIAQVGIGALGLAFRAHPYGAVATVLALVAVELTKVALGAQEAERAISGLSFVEAQKRLREVGSRVEEIQQALESDRFRSGRGGTINIAGQILNETELEAERDRLSDEQDKLRGLIDRQAASLRGRALRSGSPPPGPEIPEIPEIAPGTLPTTAIADAQREAAGFFDGLVQGAERARRQAEDQLELIGLQGEEYERLKAQQELALALDDQRLELQGALTDAVANRTEAERVFGPLAVDTSEQLAEAAQKAIDAAREQEEVARGALETFVQQAQNIGEVEDAYTGAAEAAARFQAAVKELAAEEQARRDAEQKAAEMRRAEAAKLEDELRNIEAVSASLAFAFTRFSQSAITDFENIGDAARQLVDQITGLLAQLYIFEPIQNAIFSRLGGPELAAKAASLVGSAQHGGIHQGPTLVGEVGPELVDFRTPARVYTTDQLRSALAGGSTGGTTITYAPVIQTSNPDVVRRELARTLPDFERRIMGVMSEEIRRAGPTRRIVGGR